MTATQVLTPDTVAADIRNVLNACRRSCNAADYARRLVQALADFTHSQHAVWLNWPANSGCVVAGTGGLNPLDRFLMANLRLPLLANDCNLPHGIRAVAAAPIRFRSLVAGVLAVAKGDEPLREQPYRQSDLDLLEGIGRAALAEYESRLSAEALGLTDDQRLADTVHSLRQPLGIIEACAFVLDLSLPAGETRAHEQLAEMRRQLERASGILDRTTAGYTPCESRPRADETEPEESESRVFTNSAMSMVT